MLIPQELTKARWSPVIKSHLCFLISASRLAKGVSRGPFMGQTNIQTGPDKHQASQKPQSFKYRG